MRDDRTDALLYDQMKGQSNLWQGDRRFPNLYRWAKTATEVQNRTGDYTVIDIAS